MFQIRIFDFTAEAERRGEFDNQLFKPLRLSASAVKITFETPSLLSLLQTCGLCTKFYLERPVGAKGIEFFGENPFWLTF